MSWSRDQQAMLSAMGYALYRQPPRPLRVLTPPPGFPVRLWNALVLAAGGEDPSALLPPLEQLRAGGAAKRALWPALRALRRPH
ncbi:hypothetical protein [Arenimonas alkanexedens]